MSTKVLPMITTKATTSGMPTKRQRDVRLDFFRGLCLVIIYIAHIWDNSWAQFIPARFGFSDATEIFVFCSGMASAVAFGGVFEKRGLLIGTARILHRCWQVYWSHIGLFLVVAALMVGLDHLIPPTAGGVGYVAGLGLTNAFNQHGAETLFGLMTLRFVPNFFDILPMYLVVLAMIPFVMALAKEDKRVLAIVLMLLWVVAHTGALDLPAVPWAAEPGQPNKTWFFNPFSWQLIFFTGYAFMLNWLPAPPVNALLVRLSLAFVVLSIPFTWWPLVATSPALLRWYELLAPLADKTHFGVLRYLHFLALAYLAYAAAGEKGARLKGQLVEIFRRLGQQSLAIFMSGLVLSFVASAILNITGHGILATAVVNLGGIGLLVTIAKVVTWFKASPWTKDAPKPALLASSSATADATLQGGQRLAPAE
jgi:hypothetical protein